jgi:hypothetical protein
MQSSRSSGSDVQPGAAAAAAAQAHRLCLRLRAGEGKQLHVPILGAPENQRAAQAECALSYTLPRRCTLV